jgi:hypothetical protein
MFLADLVRNIALPLQVDFVRVQSYGNDTKTSGVATISTDCKIDLKDKHIVVVGCNLFYVTSCDITFLEYAENICQGGHM